jgi:NADH:ubiquinone oxidoreductase subunit E
MSDQTVNSSPSAELPGFFGADEPLPHEEVDPSVWKVIDAEVEASAGGQERLIPLLHKTQQHLGYLPFAAQDYIARKLGISPIQVYGVVSFYNFFTTTPRGAFQVKVCTGTACFVKGAQRLVDILASELAVEVGGISDDGMFNLEQVRCIGACGLAPAIMVNDDVHGNLTPTKLRGLVRRLRKRAAEHAESNEETSA